MTTTTNHKGHDMNTSKDIYGNLVAHGCTPCNECGSTDRIIEEYEQLCKECDAIFTTTTNGNSVAVSAA